MAQIAVPEGMPGIRGLFAFRPETHQPMCDLAEILLREDSTLSRGERELIATYVSSENDCQYCQTSHGALAAFYFGGDDEIVSQVKRNVSHAPISDKLKALLKIADKVRQGGKSVLPVDIAAAREHGATDLEIHDTVLIAAAFCMFNRYVDGLGTYAPPNLSDYRARAQQVAEGGYRSIPTAAVAAA